jgi:hypothetical protein
MREIFVWGGRGVGCLQMGRVGLGRRRRNRGEEGRQRGHILIFSDGFTDEKSVGDSDRKINTSPYGSNKKSLGDSIGILNCELVTSLYRLSF